MAKSLRDEIDGLKREAHMEVEEISEEDLKAFLRRGKAFEEKFCDQDGHYFESQSDPKPEPPEVEKIEPVVEEPEREVERTEPVEEGQSILYDKPRTSLFDDIRRKDF